MNINTDTIVSMTEANRNFSQVARTVERYGEAIVFKNNRPKYRIIDLDRQSDISLTEDELIDVVARRILRDYRPAFEELANGSSSGTTVSLQEAQEKKLLTYRRLSKDDLEEVKRLYSEMGWTAYLGNDDKLYRSWEKSLFTLGAFDCKKLVGFIRCLGDGEHTVLIQDVLVEEGFQRKGIGKALMKAVFERFEDVRQFFVVTDIGSPAVAFYRELGMNTLDKGGMLAFFRL